MKSTHGNNPSSQAGKKATLSAAPKSTGRHKDSKMKPASGHAMKGGKFKK